MRRAIAALGAALAACGAQGGDPASGDAGPAPVAIEDAGATADAAPADGATPDAASDASRAPHAALPRVTYHGGGIVASPEVVVVTFDGDPLRDRLEAFGAGIGQSAWWDAVTAGACDDAGPCVGRAAPLAASAAYGHVASAAPSYSDSLKGGASTLQALLAQQALAGAIPAPDASTIYVVALPSGTTVTTEEGTTCTDFLGYHGVAAIAPRDGGAPLAVPYAVVPRCDGTEASTTATASHELVESATDPFGTSISGPGWTLDDGVWSVLLGPEVADLCAAATSAHENRADAGGFTVERSWSNASAAGGHDPCVPAPDAPYFNVAPRGEDPTTLAVGESRTITLDAFADRATADWSVEAIDLAQARGGAPYLALTLDRSKADDGATLALTVKLLAKPPVDDGAARAAYFVVSMQGTTVHYWPGAVVAK